MNNDNHVIELNKLIAELHGRIPNPRRNEQLGEHVVPNYLIDEYNRLGTSSEMLRLYPGNNIALYAIAYASLSDPATSVRMRCAQIIAGTEWEGRIYILLCCTYDPEPDVRLLALEAIAVNHLSCSKDILIRLTSDPDEFVSDLAGRLARGDNSWPIYKYNKSEN